MDGVKQCKFYYGSETSLPEKIYLHAGPVSLIYGNGDIRYVKLGDHEILRRVYAAVRDHNWNTIPIQLSQVEMDIQSNSFRISYQADHHQDDVNFVWAGSITGAPDGTVQFTFDGEARSTFQRNRIGFCILHPMDIAGKPCAVEQADGTLIEGEFPQYISPHQPFLEIRAVTHEVVPGVKAEIRMEGDIFEMEDQRNWTDASYKTYCTPLRLGFPVTVEQGTKISQSITMKLTGDLPQRKDHSADQIQFTIGDTRHSLPQIGLCVASHGEPLAEKEIDRLNALNLAHLRVDVNLTQADAEAVLRQATHEAIVLGAKLEVALHLSDAAEAELKAFQDVLAAVQPSVHTWLIFHQNEKSTTGKWVKIARQFLADYDLSALIGAGTDAYFTELNRERPPVDVLDLVTYSNNPQVHAFDNGDLVETLATQAVTVESTRQFAGDKPIAVSPVTFKIRWNPNATGPEPEPDPGELPSQVDVRQMSLFGAGWTLGSLKYMAESGAYSVTYFETTGWLGVMETEDGPPLPDQFPSLPGGVYPMYHVFASVGEFANGGVRASQSSNPLLVDGLVLHKAGKTRVLLANFTADDQPLTINGLQAGSVRVRVLDGSNVEAAMRQPEDFRSMEGQAVDVGVVGLHMNLSPYAIVCIDQMN